MANQMTGQPILLVMAAGMGSRYGGLKQLDALGPHGETMIDYSLQHAKAAGFKRLIFIINERFADAFKEKISNNYQNDFEIQLAYQELADLPEGFTVPKDRIKPWGTAHAVWSARHLIDAPFAVINADDYYGQEAYGHIYQHLTSPQGQTDYAMVGYRLRQTLSENGAVSRGLCQVSTEGYLLSIEEQTQIEDFDGKVQYTEDGVNWQEVDPDTIVSMNLWGFPADFTRIIDDQLSKFLKHAIVSNPIKGEFYLPAVVKHQLQEGRARVRVLQTPAQWFGVTYAQDKAHVQAQLQALHQKS